MSGASVAAGLLRAMGYAVLAYEGNGLFHLAEEPPAWFADLWGNRKSGREAFTLAEKSPFLENLLPELESFWASSQPEEWCSEVWIEKTSAGKDIPVQGIAMRSGRQRLLLLQSPEAQYEERRKTLQTARDFLLTHERLLTEIQKKEILLHCIVHDLSQPLSVMHVALDCLAGDEVDARAKRFLELGKLASEQQESMIREILQVFSDDLRSTMSAEREAGGGPNLLACAQLAVRNMSPTFEAKGVHLFAAESVGASTNLRIRGEETRLLRVFSNLLENALRYTPPGASVRVSVEDDGDFCKAFVDDEGPGLPADLPPSQIFALFSKGKEGGGKAGLGLYFCKITVERWGGSIGCESLPEKGSRFWFLLPKATLSAKTVVPARKKHEIAEIGRRHIRKKGNLRFLFADDLEEIRTLTAYQLERKGHQVVAVADGAAALQAFQREPFDVVLLDEEMPGKNGTQVVQAIREKEKGQKEATFVVALTGNNTPEDFQRLLAAGFDAVLGKPFRMAMLDALFQDATYPVSPPEQARGPDVVPSTPNLTPLERVGGDEKLLRRMIQTFLRDTPKRMSNLQKALARKDAPALASYAHALKGSAGLFAGQAAQELARNLQDAARDRNFPAASRHYAALKEEIAKLEENLRRYAKQPKAKRPTKGK